MKKTLLLAISLMLGVAVNAQTLLTEDFENGFSAGWTMFNDENTPPSYYHNWDTTAWGLYTSSGNPGACAAGLSFFNPRGQADRWLITPAIALPQETEMMLVFDAKSNLSSSREWLEVRICTTQPNSREDFLAQPLVQDTLVPSDWTEYSANLAPYAGQTVYLAFIVKTNDGHSLLVDNVFVGKLADNEVVLSELLLPAFAGIDSDIPVRGTLVNRGQLNLTSVDITYVVNDTLTVSGTLSGLNVAYNESYTFTAPTPMHFAESGDYAVTVSLANPNGVADSTEDNTLSTVVTLYNSNVVTDRTVLIEQFTGQTCGWCPQGHDRIEEAIEQLGVEMNWVTHHAGFYDDPLTVDVNRQMTWFYNAGGQTYAPAFMTDRTRYSLENPGPVGGIGYTPYVVDQLRFALEVPCFATIELNNVNFDEATRRVTGTVSGRMGSDLDVANARVTIYVVEDSILMMQKDYRLPQDQQSVMDYRHMNVVRGTVTGMWGDPISIDGDGNYSYAFDYTLPATTTLSNGSPINVAPRTRLVAFVGHYNMGDPNDCKVWNSVSSSKFHAAPVGLTEAEQVSVEMYPNPASKVLFVECDEQVEGLTLLDMQGRTVRSWPSNLSPLQLDGIANGMYILQVKTANTTIAKKLSILAR